MKDAVKATFKFPAKTNSSLILLNQQVSATYAVHGMNILMSIGERYA